MARKRSARERREQAPKGPTFIEWAKKWWSKTIFTNAIAILAFVVPQAGPLIDCIPGEYQVPVLALVNVILRALTKQPLGGK